MSVSDPESLARLRLARSRGIGPVSAARLLARSGSAIRALASLDDRLRAQPTLKIEIAREDRVADEFRALVNAGGTLLHAGLSSYPSALRAIPDPPPVLSVIGDPSLLSRPAIAIVGARNASSAGRRLAAMFAAELGERGFLVVSGMARGIDGVVHDASMATGTVAVLAGGVDQVYPPEHGELYARIAKTGAVVSEVPFGQVARARDFPKRNRIVAGLCRGTVVIEAADRSGTLITARLAGEQGREVCAVPGSPLDPRSAGTNRLIRNGATLVRDTDDIIEAMGPPDGAPPLRRLDQLAEDGAAGPEPDDRLESDVLSLLGYTPTHIDVLRRETGAPAAQLADAILDLVLSGRVEEMLGGLFVRSASADSRPST